MGDVTQILNAIEAGEPRAAEQLLPQVYDELRQLAAWHMAREKPGQTLDATALVHEAWLRLAPEAGSAKPQAAMRNRRYFFAAAAEAMRRILVENARRRQRIRHGGDMQRRDLDAEILPAAEPNEDLVALDEALNLFAAKYPVHAKLVELRYFAGMSGDEAAKMLDISSATADRHWVFARTWLRRAMGGTEKTENR